MSTAAVPAWWRERGMGASILVAAISAAFGVVLVTATVFIGALLTANAYIGQSHTLAFVLSFLVLVLVGVAVYVGAVVTANTFATVVAGRTRQIALMRLIGASARSQRVAIARRGLAVGLVGAAAGVITGAALAAVGLAVARAALGLEKVPFSLAQPLALVPAVVVVLTTWAAAWVGTRRVLTVTPLQALGSAVEASHEVLVRRTGRHATAGALLLSGALLLATGVLAGMVTPLGVIIAFAGGLVSFTGIALGATLVMPPVLRLVGALFGRGATARLAAENALRFPERSSRMAIGVVIGVTLVTMLAVATETTKAVLTALAHGQPPAPMTAVLDTVMAIMISLVAVSAVIAGVGLVNLLTLGVAARTREFGLMRALGLSGGQVRALVLLEAAHVTIAALAAGLVLGIVYGWAGAQSLLGSVGISPDAPGSGTFVPPALPVLPLLAVIGATAVLTLVAAVVPTRLATRVSPVAALAD